MGRDNADQVQPEELEPLNDQEEGLQKVNQSVHSSSTVIESFEDEIQENGQLAKVKKSQSSQAKAALNLFKGFAGVGILALPKSFQLVGNGLGLSGLIMSGFFNYYAMSLCNELCDSKLPNEKLNYQKLAYEKIGKKGALTVEISIFIMQTGLGISYLLFANQFFHYVFCQFNIHSLCTTDWYNVIFCAIIVLPLSLINNMVYFYIPSLLSTVFLFIGIIAQLIYDVEYIERARHFWPELASSLADFHILNLPLFFGVAIFAFEGIGVMFDIKNSMEKPKKFKNILSYNLLFLTIIYSMFAAMSNTAFGENTPDVVLFSMPKSAPYLLVQCLYAVAALLTYPLQLNPAIRIMENSWIKERIFDDRGQTKNGLLRYGARFGVQVVMFLIAFSAKSFQLFLNFLGCCVFTYLVFILPIIIYHKHHDGKYPLKIKIMNILTIIIGSVLGSIGVVLSIIKMAEGEGGHHNPETTSLL